MTEQSHVHHATDDIQFSVTDMTESRRFYEAAFDWRFSVQKRGGEAGGMQLESEVSPGGPLVILYSNDLEETIRKVREAGARITKEAFAFPGGRRFHFADPSGKSSRSGPTADRAYSSVSLPEHSLSKWTVSFWDGQTGQRFRGLFQVRFHCVVKGTSRSRLTSSGGVRIKVS